MFAVVDVEDDDAGQPFNDPASGTCMWTDISVCKTDPVAPGQNQDHMPM